MIDIYFMGFHIDTKRNFLCIEFMNKKYCKFSML